MSTIYPKFIQTLYKSSLGTKKLLDNPVEQFFVVCVCGLLRGGLNPQNYVGNRERFFFTFSQSFCSFTSCRADSPKFHFSATANT